MIQILIADDEKLECDALEKMIRENYSNIHLLPSVYDGQALVQSVKENKPDIVIADINMPKMNGLDALELLCASNEQMEILIHTAYNDFDYIHRALKMGAADYLLKPVYEDDFLEVFYPILSRTLNRKRSQTEGTRKEQLAEDLQTVAEKNIMMGLLLGRPDEKSWKLYQSTFGKEPTKEEAVVFSISFDVCENRDMLYQMLAEELKRKQKLLFIVYKDTLYCLVLDMQYANIPEKIRKFAVVHDISYQIGISSVMEGYKNFPSAVSEADIARQNVQENSCGYFEISSYSLRTDYFSGMESRVARLMMSDHMDLAYQEIIEHVSKTFSDGKVNLSDCFYAQKMISKAAEALKMDWRRTGVIWLLPSLLSDLAKEIQIQKSGSETIPSGASHYGHSAVSRGKDVDLLLLLMKKELQQMECDLKRPLRKENTYVTQALLFIHQYYMNDISLEQTASEIGISQFYLSRLLKQERNLTFLELLTYERLGYALKFMADPSRNIQNISTAVGYKAKYFYQIFRNVTGFSQKEFRDALFLNKEESDNP